VFAEKLKLDAAFLKSGAGLLFDEFVKSSSRQEANSGAVVVSGYNLKAGAIRHFFNWRCFEGSRDQQ
jgi:hypothetical protein